MRALHDQGSFLCRVGRLLGGLRERVQTLASLSWGVHLGLAGLVVTELFVLILCPVSSRGLLSNIIQLLGNAAAGFFLTRTAMTLRRRGDGSAGGWALLATSAWLWILGMIIYTVMDSLQGKAPYPGVPDAFFLLSYPLIMLGLLRMQQTSPITPWEQWNNVLDLSALGLIASVLIWHLNLRPMTSSLAANVTSTGVVSILYTICDFLIILTIFSLLLRRNNDRQHVTATLLLLAGVFWLAVGDLGQGCLAQEGMYTSGTVLDMAWVLFGVFASMGAFAASKPPDADAKVHAVVLQTIITTGFTITWMAAVFSILLWAVFRPDMRSAFTFAATGAVCLLAVIRQLRMVRENSRLYASLQLAQESLEKQVLERTEELAHANRLLTAANNRLQAEIADKARAEAALRESEEMHRLFFEMGAVGMVYVGTDGRLLRVNERYCEITGYSRQELAQTTVFELTHPEDRQKERERFNAHARGERPVCVHEKRYVCKDGSARWVHLTARMICESDGRPRHSIATIEDITERKRTEEALRESDKKYRSLYRSILDGFGIVDMQGRITEVNQGLLDMLGYTVDEIQQLTYEDITPARWHNMESNIVREQVLKRGYSDVYEKEYRRKNGTVFPVELRAYLMRNSLGNPEGIWAFVRDISERQRAQEDRIILSKLESTGVLAGGIAHDFNNLLQAILLNVNLAETQESLHSDARDYLGAARAGVEAAQNLTKQLITFAKGGAPVRKPLLVSELIRSAARLSLSGSNIRCDLHLDDTLFWTNVDGAQIEQVIRNLLLNARDAMPEGGVVTVRAENVTLNPSELPELAAGNHVRVTVADQGAGILPEVLPKIFDPYFSTKQRGADKGMGLGLTICHTIIKKHDGSITVSSQPGVGTVFQFHLPACAKPERIETTHRAVATPLRPPRPRAILVMDDEHYMRFAIGSVLEGKGFRVELANDGQNAIDLYSQAMRNGSPFDAVILDLTVRGGMGGKEAIDGLAKVDPSVKAIVMSGYSDDPTLLNPQQYGFKAGMEKSFDIDQLVGTITRILADSNPDDSPDL